MKRYLSLFVAVNLLCAQGAVAQQNSISTPPAPGNVTLSLDEYNRLLALANRPGKHAEVPPVPYILKSADLKFRVHSDDVLGSVQFEGETLSANSAKVPLVSGMTVFDGHHGGKALPLLLEGNTHAAVLPGEAEFAVSLDAGLPLTIDTGRASFSLPVPSAGSARLTLTVPGERTNVQLNHGIITHRASVGGNTEIEATLRPGEVANIWWNTREVVAPVTPREARFLSDVKSLISVTESDLQIAALIDVNVLQGEPEQFSMAIPSGFEVTAVNGASLESSEVQNGMLLLKIIGHATGAQQFLVTLERPLNDSQSAAPILAVKDAQRETGEVLVEGQGTLELTAQESGGLKRLDLKEINPYLRALSRYSLQAAFRYHRQSSESPALALSWTRFPGLWRVGGDRRTRDHHHAGDFRGEISDGSKTDRKESGSAIFESFAARWRDHSYCRSRRRKSEAGARCGREPCSTASRGFSSRRRLHGFVCVFAFRRAFCQKR